MESLNHFSITNKSITMGNFIDSFIDKFLVKEPVTNTPKTIEITAESVMIIKNKVHSVPLKDAARYLDQWKTYKNEYDTFLTLAKDPSNFSNPKSNICELRDNLLQYELINSETFDNKEFLNELGKALQSKDVTKLKILNGIKTADDIVNLSQIKCETRLEILKYLSERGKNKIECFIFILIKN